MCAAYLLLLTLISDYGLHSCTTDVKSCLSSWITLLRRWYLFRGFSSFTKLITFYNFTKSSPMNYTFLFMCKSLLYKAKYFSSQTLFYFVLYCSTTAVTVCWTFCWAEEGFITGCWGIIFTGMGGDKIGSCYTAETLGGFISWFCLTGRDCPSWIWYLNTTFVDFLSKDLVFSLIPSILCPLLILIP